MKITSFRTVLPAFLLLGSNNVFHASAAVIAYWNFNNLSVATAGAPGTGDVPSTIAADQGSGTLELFGAWNGLVDDFDGSTINALNGDPAGASLSLVSDAGNGSGILITGLSFPDSNPVVVSFAVRATARVLMTEPGIIVRTEISSSPFRHPTPPPGPRRTNRYPLRSR